MQTLESAVDEFRNSLTGNRLSNLSESEASVPASPERWTPKQILGHLLDSAANNHHRFVRAQIEGGLSMPGYAQREWVETQRYQDRTWTELLAFWTSYNRHLLHLMERTPDSQRKHLCRIGDDKPVTLEFLMIDYVNHLKHHLDQMHNQ
jgi:hypothetical protein